MHWWGQQVLQRLPPPPASPQLKCDSIPSRRKLRWDNFTGFSLNWKSNLLQEDKELLLLSTLLGDAFSSEELISWCLKDQLAGLKFFFR